jgi:hypothetical protein
MPTVASRIYAKYVAAYGAALSGGAPMNAFTWDDEKEEHAAVAIGVHDGKNNNPPQTMHELISEVERLFADPNDEE